MIQTTTIVISMVLLVLLNPFVLKSEAQNVSQNTTKKIDDEFDALVEIKFKKTSTSTTTLKAENSRWEKSVRIPCQLNHDQLCSIAWLYEPKTDEVSFQLTFKIPQHSAWIAIGFNKITKMIGTSVIMIKIDGPNLKLYNGYLKYYNRPLIENLDLTEIEKEEEDGVMKLTFKRSVSLETISDIDLNDCNYVVVATGPLIDDQMRMHNHVPQFSSQCFRLANTSHATTKMTSLSTKIVDFSSLMPTKTRIPSSVWKSLKIAASTKQTKNLNITDILVNFTLANSINMLKFTSKSTERPKIFFITNNKVPTKKKKPIYNEFLIDDKLVRYENMLVNASKLISSNASTSNNSNKHSTNNLTDYKKIYSHFERKKVFFKNGVSTGSITSRSLDRSSSKLSTSTAKIKLTTKSLISDFLIPNSTAMELEQSVNLDIVNKTLPTFLLLVDFVVNRTFDDSVFNRSSSEFINFDQTVKKYIKTSFESKSLIGYNYSEISNIIPQKEGYLLRVMLLYYSFKNQSNHEFLNRLKSSLESGDKTTIPIVSNSIQISEYKNEFQGQKMNPPTRGSMSYMFLFIFGSVFGSLSLFCTAFLLIVYYIYQKKISHNLVNISKASGYLVRV